MRAAMGAGGESREEKSRRIKAGGVEKRGLEPELQRLLELQVGRRLCEACEEKGERRTTTMQGMERLQRIFSGASGMGHPPTDSPQLDSAEQVYISSLALLKMLKHGTGRAGVPMEVMDLFENVAEPSQEEMD